MKRICLTLAFLLLTCVAQAQTENKQPAANKTASADAALELKERRARARSLLIALSTDARSFHDQTLRARSLARIADALWPVDSDQGRLLFRKAWDAAEVADQDSERKLQEDIARQKARTGGAFAISLPPNVRREVLRLAARHDKVLSEEFLEKLKTQKQETATSKPNFSRPNEAVSQRLSVAKELLANGDLDRAVQFAGPALTTPSIETIDFLSVLREKNPAPADSAYAAMLASSANNPQSDPNTVSVLSSYIFTPHLYIMFTGNGFNTTQQSQTVTPALVAPELRNAFFQTAAAILLRPLPPPAELTASVIDIKYLAVKRLLPLFEQSAPSGMVESLRGQLNALNAIASDNARGNDDEWIDKGLKPDKPEVDREQKLLDQIERARTSSERDSLYVTLTIMLTHKGEMRAREFVSKIEDTETRKQVQGYVDPSLALYFVGKKKTDEPLELVDKGELSHLQKSWVLSECAKLLARTERDKALDLLDQAADEARRIEPLDAASPQALFAVANGIKAVDATRVWDATFDAVKAANSSEGFTGEDGKMVLKFQSSGGSSVHTSDVPEFDLEGIFRDLAQQDYDRAVELARGFQGEGPRAVATIAIARAILAADKRK